MRAGAEKDPGEPLPQDDRLFPRRSVGVAILVEAALSPVRWSAASHANRDEARGGRSARSRHPTFRVAPRMVGDGYQLSDQWEVLWIPPAA
jgi:hypothetical protein